MKHNIIKILFTATILVVTSGCAMQPERSGPVAHFSTFCTLAGAVVGGGGVAAMSLAAGPIGAGVFVGALLGSLACTAEDPPIVAAEPMPAPAPQPIAAAPELDSDGDGVIDRLDRCPDTLAGQKVDTYGCPDILLVLTGINFKFDSSQIEPDSERILNQAVETLNKASSVDVRIEGHTDSTGSDAYNDKLSHRRANAVRDYLVQHGIAAARLTTDGKGESQPVASNDTADGRYQNRRVEFHTAGSHPHSYSDDSSSNDMSIESWRRLDQTVVYY